MSAIRPTNHILLFFPIAEGKVEALREFMLASWKHRLEDLSIPTFFDEVGTVHFYQWAIPPGDTYLMLETHYDGDLQPYLDDFWRLGHEQFKKILSFCKGYPEKGLQSSEEFTQFVAPHVHDPVSVGSAYEGVTVREIRRALNIAASFQDVLDQYV